MKTRRLRPWQEAQCPATDTGSCLAKCEAACLCQNGNRDLVQLFCALVRWAFDEEAEREP
jgi:hypothetical protein